MNQTLLEKVRKSILDKAELNIILKDKEFSDESLWDSIEYATDEFNQKYNPQLSYAPTDVPYYILLSGTIASLMNKVYVHGNRNSIQYRDNGVSFDWFGGRAARALQAIQKYETEFDHAIRRYKARLNAELYSGAI